MAHSGLLTPDGVGALIDRLRSEGYRVIGPTLVAGAIGYGELTSPDDLPVGWSDVQDAGSYELLPRGDGAFFGHVVGPHSPKRVFHPPRSVVWSGRRANGSFVTLEAEQPPKVALFGIRPCDIAAIRVQDHVLMPYGGPQDAGYAARRQDAFIVAVDCLEPGGTCFCDSMGTGPTATEGFDLALTELLAGSHRFLVRVGSDRGAAMLEAVAGVAPAGEDDELLAERLRKAAADRMGRSLDTSGLAELLAGNLENRHWDDVADRCMACTNCTMVCPTCFCTTIDDELSLDGEIATRAKRWDSCFTLEFSYIHGGPVRQGPEARYRQWITHKLSSWVDQFGEVGCVGCGRCITWCPVGIDITREAAAIRQTDVRRRTTMPISGVAT